MFTEIYIAALLADEEAADRVWEAWYSQEIDDSSAIDLWMQIPKKEYLRG